MRSFAGPTEGRERMVLQALCGVFQCSDCKYQLKQLCPGCEPGNEMLAAQGKSVCRIFECVRVQDVESCGDCSKATCQVYKQPELTCPLRSEFQNPRWWLAKMATHFGEKSKEYPEAPNSPSQRVVTRMQLYLHALDEFAGTGITTISSWRFARKLGITPGLIRKDLSFFGGFGKRGVGYNVTFLRQKISTILGLDRVQHIAWIGGDKLVQDPQLPERLTAHNCRIVAVFDTDPERLGTHVGDLQVMQASMIGQVVKNLDVDVAVVACADEDAQWVADQLVSAGVTAVLNLTAAILVVPGNVTVHNLDVASEIFALSYYCGLHGRQDSP